MGKDKTKPFNILILGAGSNVSQGIIKAIRDLDGDYNLIGACVSKNSVGLYMCDKALISPYAVDSSFVDWYINVCNDFEIDMVFTGVEEIINTLSDNREYISKNCNAIFIYPEENSWKIGRDKYLTCEWFKNNGFDYPHYAMANNEKELKRLVDECGYPLVGKPVHGKSSIGVKVINTDEELFEAINNEDYVIEECVGTSDEEYTVGCYCNKNGELVSHIIFRRILKNGTSSICDVVTNDIISEYIENICKKMKPIGPINFQLRCTEDRVVCFECNVRYSGTTAIRNHFGFNDVQAGINEYLYSENIDNVFKVKTGCAIRYDEELYFDINIDELMKNVFDNKVYVEKR